MKRFEK